ncbi:transketolase [Candidatus Deferrimicrobium sp.]|uniref:transketolase n=1 Tax=Candidatus Deferrimicrobium sp. TaxID=3060586 RepID=UPI0032C22DA7
MEETVEKNALALRAINTIRFLSVDAVQKAKSGHPGTPMGLAPVSYLLWTKYLRYNPANPDWTGRDRFVLSCGHASMLLYSLLHLTGFDVTLDDLQEFRQWGSKTPGHPEAGHTPGVEVTTGPLGQGLGNAVGMAMASRMLAQRFNRPGHEIVSHRIVALCSDGDMMEGVASEASSLAGFHRLGNLVAFYDDNRITIEGSTDLAFREDVGGRFRAYGWNVLNVADGNTDLAGLSAAIEVAFAERERPTLVIVRTSIGFGSPNKQDTAEAHGAPLGEAEVALTKERLGWPVTPAFHVPDDVLAHFREALGRGETAEKGWRMKFAAYAAAYPALSLEWERRMWGDLPEGWAEGIPTFLPEAGAVATRSASKSILNAIAAKVPELAGGSADLAPSTETIMKDAGEFLPDAAPGGRNVHFGVREHGMGTILNGMARHGGMIPYGATFFIFTDYMRPSIRLAALMGCRVVYVLTHDSVGLGEDGPTHQPVEHLASLRAMPNLHVVRPADANETAAAWRGALERTQGPTAIVLTRQKIPVLSPSSVHRDDGVGRGAYVLSDAEGGRPDVLLLASGSEVHVALAAKKLLSAEGVAARVVSMPCWERFEEQEAEYREAVLPPSVSARVSVEAGSIFGWERYVGDRGASIGIDRFGASAPAERIFRELGITPEAVRDLAKSVLAAARGGSAR